ncbi:uncharacterized protein LY89DRAFT_724195 [Mollisia scopiformis]|uniref:Uncharacterized protein n=1 Tax=Mollisia scopiformis TaxID=149040 RepID=A0A132BBN4_MOLSC|nr:uncharacterized protein LY89DRAFT_724195 [Mollisia scopiformis]KUJ09806.1 hypothetical protein LY89DRAFT_724195 [Mollisia scopiformis]
MGEHVNMDWGSADTRIRQRKTWSGRGAILDRNRQMIVSRGERGSENDGGLDVSSSDTPAREMRGRGQSRVVWSQRGDGDTFAGHVEGCELRMRGEVFTVAWRKLALQHVDQMRQRHGKPKKVVRQPQVLNMFLLVRGHGNSIDGMDGTFLASNAGLGSMVGQRCVEEEEKGQLMVPTRRVSWIAERAEQSV